MNAFEWSHTGEITENKLTSLLKVIIFIALFLPDNEINCIFETNTKSSQKSRFVFKVVLL